MTHNLIRSDEAEWPRHQRFFAAVVQQFGRKRINIKGHLVAFMAGGLLAAIMVIGEHAAR